MVLSNWRLEQNMQRAIPATLRQRAYGRLTWYEDINHGAVTARLHLNPILRRVVGRQKKGTTPLPAR